MKKEYINPQIEVQEIRLDTILQSTSNLSFGGTTGDDKADEARFRDILTDDDEDW